MRPGKRKALDKDNEADAMIDKVENFKAGIRAKVNPPKLSPNVGHQQCF
jgi:IS5 family transposase